MSNSPLVNHINISKHRTSPRRHEIDMISIHCVVGQCHIEPLGELFQVKRASSNYGIGTDGRIGMYVEEKDRSWCSGGVDKYKRDIRVNGISGGDNDHRGVTIEVASDTKPPYAINNKAYASLINLCVDICKRNGIKELKWKADKTLTGQVDEQNMYVHRWFAYKDCPGDYLYERYGAIAQTVNNRLNAGNTIKIGDEDMTVDEFTKLYNAMRKKQQDNDASLYSKEARDWAIKTGLILGGGSGATNYMWEDVVSREQFVTLLYRFAKWIGKA